MFRNNPRFQNRPLTAGQIALLARANKLMLDGKPSEAGPLFAQLAKDLQSSNHPRRAANLYARAAHAFADCHDEQAALGLARTALSLFIQFKMAQRAPVFYANITQKMSNKGMKSAADTLQREFGAQIALPPSELEQGKHPQRGLLPTSCPKCGGPVHSEDINWVDENTAECEYCGTLIRTEK